MKRMLVAGLLAAAFVVSATWTAPAVDATPQNPQSCWGQASAVFARTGEMGEHASAEPTPRLGLRNLARALFDAGIIADDSMEALGQFVADALGLTIEACQ